MNYADKYNCQICMDLWLYRVWHCFVRCREHFCFDLHFCIFISHL